VGLDFCFSPSSPDHSPSPFSLPLPSILPADEFIVGVNIDGSAQCRSPPKLAALKTRLDALDGNGGPVDVLNGDVDAALTLGTWGTWSECSEPCGGGVRRRTRSFSIDGTVQGEIEDAEECNTPACPGEYSKLS
jgi:hypothetical protein